MRAEAELRADGVVPEVVRTAPARIYLQVSDDRDHESEPFPDAHGDEVTWCADSVLACEVEYIRADLAPASPAAAKESDAKEAGE